MSKAQSILSKSFVENTKDLGEDQLGELVVKAEIKIKELQEEQKNDDKLNAAKQIVKDLNAGYAAVVKMEKAKVAYLIEKIQEIQEGINPDASV
jgi:hypothetical protein